MIESKNRLTIRQEWMGKGVVLRFPVDGQTVEIEHDLLIKIIHATNTPYLESSSWQVDGWYSIAHPNHTLRAILSSFAID